MTEPNDFKKTDRNNRLRSYARYSGIAFQMIGIILLGSFIGVKLDEHFEKDKLFTVIFSLSSVFISLYFVIRQIRKNSSD